MNALEREPAGSAWIAAMEARLARDYQPFFARFERYRIFASAKLGHRASMARPTGRGAARPR